MLTLLTGTGMAATSIYLPSLPNMARDLGIGVGEAQASFTIYLVAYAFGQLVLGPLTDRFGRRLVMLGGLATLVGGSLACTFAPGITPLLAARATQAVGAAVGAVVSRAVIRDIFTRAETARATSILGAAIAVVPLISPLVGGYIEETLGWRWNFALITLLASTASVLLVIWLPETYESPDRSSGLFRSVITAYRTLIVNRTFLGFTLVNFGTFAALQSFNITAPVLMIDGLGLSPLDFGRITAITGLAYFIGSMLSTRLTLRLGLERMVTIGVLAMLTGGLLTVGLVLFGHVSLPGIYIPRALWSIGMGIALPNAIAGAVSVNPRSAGSAASLSGFLQTAGGAIGAGLANVFPKTDPLTFAGLFAALATAGALAWLLLGPRPGEGGQDDRSNA